MNVKCKACGSTENLRADCVVRDQGKTYLICHYCLTAIEDKIAEGPCEIGPDRAMNLGTVAALSSHLTSFLWQ